MTSFYSYKESYELVLKTITPDPHTGLHLFCLTNDPIINAWKILSQLGRSKINGTGCFQLSSSLTPSYTTIVLAVQAFDSLWAFPKHPKPLHYHSWPHLGWHRLQNFGLGHSGDHFQTRKLFRAPSIFRNSVQRDLGSRRRVHLDFARFGVKIVS